MFESQVTKNIKKDKKVIIFESDAIKNEQKFAEGWCSVQKI